MVEASKPATAGGGGARLFPCSGASVVARRIPKPGDPPAGRGGARGAYEYIPSRKPFIKKQILEAARPLQLVRRKNRSL